MATAEIVYRYRRPSSLSDDGLDLALETWTPTAPEPVQFFSGFAERAEVVAAGLLAVAQVARTRFYTPGNMIAAKIRAADPVVTCDGQQLRFESLSVCCGVYARFDLLPTGIDGETLEVGTTNVDVNPPLRDALGKVGTGDPMRIDVGPEEVRVRTLDDDEVERKVALPTRWLKSFAEVAGASSEMTAQFSLRAPEARRVLSNLPGAQTRGRMWLAPSGATARLSPRYQRDAVHLSAPERLRPLAGVLPWASRLDVFGPDPDGEEPGASEWVLDLPGGRLTVGISPVASRAFSGEGGVLESLGDDNALDASEQVGRALESRQRATLDQLAATTGLMDSMCSRALRVLAAAGRVGYDVTTREFFARALPFDPDIVQSMHPRLVAARRLVDSDKVRVSGDEGTVLSGDTRYTLRRVDGRWVCTCPWEAEHRGNRGQCKHGLAVAMVAGE